MTEKISVKNKSYRGSTGKYISLVTSLSAEQKHAFVLMDAEQKKQFLIKKISYGKPEREDDTSGNKN